MDRVIAERYRVEASLGVGGMGAVYRVHDKRLGRSLALKELRAGADENDALLVSQFEREYHTLIQLRHPSIVEVYDYGVDEKGHPYYTMELLDGEDLRERATPTWQEACTLLRDVASSLAILHSRRLLHRDISARNIRCTSQGGAKLIDFGAMAPMGVLKFLVGTPPFVPPEALQLQSLDGRSDLFAFGALFYWLMTRRHAYPARNFTELPDLWRTPIASPRQYDADLPPALDQLIMQLLQLDRNARPASAADVIERLCGIANLSMDERPAVSAAYLATPVLVGREELLQQVRALQVHARRGRGAAVLIEGAPGAGRSRALDACVLDAKLLGAVVLRGDAADSASGDYGLARSLAEQLFSALPRLARRAALAMKDVLSQVLPQLREPQGNSMPTASDSLAPNALTRSSMSGLRSIPISMPGIVFETDAPVSSSAAALSTAPAAAGSGRRQLQAALRDFLLAVARERHLVVAVDDVDAIDEPSAALLAILAHSAQRRKLTLLVCGPESSRVPDASSSALALLRQMAERLTLAPLSAEQSEALLRSVFGDVPNIAAVSDRVHRIAGGNPRWTMALAEHLVSRGLARYQTGSWALPATLAAGDVPASLTESLTARLSELSADARALAEVLALTDAGLIPASAYPRLTGDAEHARTYAALSDLVASGVLVAAGEGYRFSHVELAALVRARIDPDRARVLHGLISRELSRAEHPMQLAEHQLLGGREREGIQLVLALAGEELPRPPVPMLALVERALHCAERVGEPLRVRLDLRCRVLIRAGVLGDYPRFTALLPEILECVVGQSGLADYDQLAELSDPAARLAEALRRAEQRHAATPEFERGFHPRAAGMWLGIVWGGCAYMAAIAQERRFVERLPSVAPLVPSAPQLSLSDAVIDGQRAMQAGRISIATGIAATLLRTLDGPGFAGMSPAMRTYLRAPFVYTLGIFDAVAGKASALEYVRELNLPDHRSNAWRMRMVYELMHGRSEAAAASQRRAELLALQDSGSAMLPGTTVRTELLAAICAEDLIAVKRCVERSEALAAVYPCWRSTSAVARAHYRRLQGDLNSALIAAEEAVAHAPAGRHIDWCDAASIQLDVLTALDRTDEAFALGESYLTTAAHEQLHFESAPLVRSMAECCVRSGRLEDALRMAERHLQQHIDAGTQGLQLGRAYETRARVAIALRDEAGLAHYAQLCAATYKGSRNALLSRKYQELLREADVAGVSVGAVQRQAAEFTEARSVSDAMHTLRSRLLGAVGEDERVEQALRVLLETHGASAGYLFAIRDGQLELLAGSTADAPSPDLVRTLEGYLAAVSQPAQQHASADADDEATMMQPLTEAASSEATAYEELPGGALDAPRFDQSVDGFEPLPLFAAPGPERVLVALAALRFEGHERKAVSRAVLTAFAEALLNRDDA